MERMSALDYVKKQQALLLKKPGADEGPEAQGPHRPPHLIKVDIKNHRDAMNCKEIAKDFYYGTIEYDQDVRTLAALRREYKKAGGTSKSYL